MHVCELKIPTRRPTTRPPQPTNKPTEYPTHSPTTEAPSTPTTCPEGNIYCRSFEKPNFPEQYPEWSTDDYNEYGNDTHWYRTNETAAEGIYSIRTPVLASAEGTPRRSGVTLTTRGSKWKEGHLYFSLWANVEWPNDILEVYVDEEYWDEYEMMTEWVEVSVYLPEGTENVTWGYSYNPFGNTSPPPQGEVFLDYVYFIEEDAPVTDEPTKVRRAVHHRVNYSITI